MYIFLYMYVYIYIESWIIPSFEENVDNQAFMQN